MWKKLKSEIRHCLRIYPLCKQVSNSPVNENGIFMKPARKVIICVSVVLHLATAQSLETRDYVLSNKSERRILNEILLDSNMTNKNVKIVRQSKNWFNKSKTRKLDVNDSRNTRTEVFEQKTIIDDYGNEKIVFVRSQLNINDTTTNMNRKITFS